MVGRVWGRDLPGPPGKGDLERDRRGREEGGSGGLWKWTFYGCWEEEGAEGGVGTSEVPGTSSVVSVCRRCLHSGPSPTTDRSL